MRCRRVAAIVWLLGVAASPLGAAVPTGGQSAAPAGPIIGHLAMVPCGSERTLCGRLRRPLDPTGRVGGSIGIAFAFSPHRNRALPPRGLIVGAEGGPGYSGTAALADYAVLFAPLLDRWDLLVMDNRGTGGSQAIDCDPLQSTPRQTIAAVGACGRALGAAAGLYGTGLAADDLAALLDALGAGRIDLYGDSYGTYFGQVFAGRHPERLRSLVLDGAYPVIGEDPFYGAAGAAVRRASDIACRRAPTCRDLPGDSLSRIVRLLDRLRARPIVAKTLDTDGTPMIVTADAAAIGNILYDGTSGGLNLRELDPAARALLDGDDAEPLLRLIAENIRTEGDGLPGGPPDLYSRGLNAAVSCLDYPQLYDMTAAPERRRAQSAARIAAKAASDPGVYAPLTLSEWLRLPLDLSVLEQCVEWPLPVRPYAPGQPIPPGAAFPAVPTLVISGELDVLTTPEEAAIVTKQFPAGRHLLVANSFHVDAVGDTDDCAAVIVRRFVSSLDPGDMSCAAVVKPLRMPPAFPRHAADTPPAIAQAGNKASPADLAVAAASVQTAGDALARWWLAGGNMPGLRGGSFSADHTGGIVTLTLHALHWTDDLAVSGRVKWDQTTGAVAARLTLAGPDHAQGVLDARWNDRDAQARATLSGRFDGRRVAAEMFAP